MVTKNRTGEKKRNVKVGKLKFNKETVKDLTAGQHKQVKGGFIAVEHNQIGVRRLDDINNGAITDLRDIVKK